MLPPTLDPKSYRRPSATGELDFDGPIAIGAHGMAVKRIQEWLCFAKIGVAVDSDFGPATRAAVQAFQGGSGLPTTGAVDLPTWSALVAAMVDALRPIDPRASLGDQIVATARQHLAVHPVEIGGDNRGPWVRLYNGADGTDQRWCAGFATFCLEQACHDRAVAQPIHSSVSWDAIAGFAKAAGLFYTGTAVAAGTAPPPNAGDFFLVRSGPADWTHVGIVTYASATSFHTIEGNTDHGGSANGYEVAEQTRGYGGKDFVRL